MTKDLGSISKRTDDEKPRARMDQPDFPPLAQLMSEADPHTFCGVATEEVGCKCLKPHKVQFLEEPAMRRCSDDLSSESGSRHAGEFGLLNEDYFSTTESSDGEQCENSFDSLKAGHDVELLLANKTARRKLPIGGSRLVVGHLGVSTGQVVWRVRIDRCGLEERSHNADVESAMRMKRTNVHGIKIGVAQKGANLKWFAGFDKNSWGLDWQGDVWSEGKPIKTHLIDGGRQRGVCFKTGDVVSVVVEFNSEKPTLKFAVNDSPLPGAYYLSTYKPDQELFVAISLLWPGEQATFISEELYE